MPMTIAVEDADGERVDALYDGHDWLIYMIEKTRQPNAPCPRVIDYVDQVGDTMFNPNHMERLSKELELIKIKVKDETGHEWLDALIELVQTCVEKRYYLKLYGD